MNGRPSSCWPDTWQVHTAAAPSAITASGTIWANACMIGIGRNMPTTWRAVHGAGRDGVDDRADGRLDLDRRQRAGVVRHLGVEHGAHREGRVGVGVVLHDVDAERAGARRALVVDEDLAGHRVDGDGDGDGDLRAVGEVDHRRRPHGAGRQGADRSAGGLLRAADDLVGQVLDVVEPVGVHQRGEALRADLRRGPLGVQVAGHVVGLAHVGEDEPPHVVVALALRRTA